MSGRFTFSETPLVGLIVVKSMRISDERGSLERVFDRRELHQVFGDRDVAQVNRTVTLRRGAVRGMHLQRPPHAEMKLVSCSRGAVFDVAVDLREGSASYLRWHAETLTEQNGRAMIIPEGFAHGFQALTDGCELIYVHSAPYDPGAEAGVNPLEPRLGITWPEPITLMSARDRSWPTMSGAETDVSR